ncbi:MAG: hypothetical protein VYB72_06665 [Planctomycetota bacterium]|nr:hypothetical protein [Planctomycetota bacterium]
MQKEWIGYLVICAHQVHLPGGSEKKRNRPLNVLVTVWCVMRMESIDDPHSRTGVSMSVTRSIAALSAILMSSAFALAEEPSSQWLASVGLANLEAVTTQESMEVRGQGFSTGVSRSASAMPGTFTYNLAEAKGVNFAKTLSSSLSELDIYLSGDHGGNYGSYFGYPSPGNPYSSHGPVMNGRHSVGASGFSLSSSN